MFRMDVFEGGKVMKVLRNLMVVVLLCLVCGMMLSAVSDDSDAAVGDRFTIDDITYEVTKEGAVNEVEVDDAASSITSYDGTSSVSNGGVQYSVTSIGYRAFIGCSGLTSVTIGNSVTSIGDHAFDGCTGLTSVTIPDKVTFIGYWAFDGCHSLVEVFNKSSLNIIKGTSDNGYVAYYALNVYTPESGSSILIDDVDNEDYVFMKYDGSYYLVKYIGNNTIVSLPEQFKDGNNVVTSYGIWEYAFYQNTKIVQVTIPNSVTSIGSSAFSGCRGLTSVTIPDSVTSIGYYAFYGCTGLKELTIPISLNAVGSNSSPAFSGCTNIEKVTFTVGSGKGRHYGTNSSSGYSNYFGYTPWYLSRGSLVTIVIEDGVTSIGDYAFYGCTGLKELTIPISLNAVGSNSSLAFSGCTNIEKVTFTVGSGKGYHYGTNSSSYYSNYYGYTPWYLSRNSLITIVIEDGVTSIGDYAFYGCTGLTSVTIPDSVTSIGYYAFYGCTGLKELTIPISLNAVGSNNYPAFSGCTNIEKVTFTAGTGEGYDYGTNRSNTYSDYYGYTPWHISNGSLKSIVLHDGILSIGDYGFYGCSNLKNIANLSRMDLAPGSSLNGYVSYYATNILEGEYFEYEGLEFLYDYDNSTAILLSVPSDTKELELDSIRIYGKKYLISDIFPGALILCDDITTCFFGPGFKTIPSGVFENHPSLKSISISEGTESIAAGAFSNCSNLTEITVPIGLNTVTDNADPVFAGCTNIRKITFIAGDGFDYSIDDPVSGYQHTPWYINKGSLETIIISEGVTSIGDCTFRGCTGITSIILPASLSSIGHEAFYGCTGLTSLIVSEDNNTYSSQGGVVFNKDMTELVLCPNGRSVSTYIIPDHVTSISPFAFHGCTNITGFSISANNQYFNVDRMGVLYNRDMSVLIAYPPGRTDATFVVPDTVSEIYPYAFYGCTSLTELTVPISTDVIGDNDHPAFYGCVNLRSITFSAGTGDGIDYIGAGGSASKPNYKNTPWYLSRASLETVLFLNGIVSIGDNMFYDCISVMSVCIPDTVTSLGSNSFYGCTSLEELTLPISLNAAGSTNYPAFKGCTNLVSVNFTSGTGVGFDYVTVNGIGCYTDTPWHISKASLKSVSFDSDIEHIGDYTIAGCYTLASLTLPDQLKSIGNASFKGLYRVNALTIPYGVTEIGDYAFAGCTYFERISFGDAMEIIGEDAFDEYAFYDSDGITLLECTANNLKGSVFTGNSEKMIRQETHTVTFRITGMIVAVVPYLDGDESVTEPSTRDIPGYVMYWPDYELDGDVIVDAIIELRRSTVSFDPNGGTGSMGDMETNIEIPLSPECSFTAPDHSKFIGWALSANGDVLELPIYISEDTVLFAIWELEKYDVVYRVDGNVEFTDTFDYGTVVDVRDLFVKKGYTVSDWVTDDVTVSEDKFTLGASDVVFEATSTVNKYGYTVNYVDSEGNALADKLVGEADYGSAIEAVLAQVTGYTAPSAVEIIIIDDPAKNVVSYVYTINQYDIVYKVDGNVEFTDTFDYNTVVAVRDIFVKTGHTVSDWVTDDVPVSEGKFTLGASDVVFEATSTVNEYTITFDTAGGSAIGPMTQDYGTTITKPTNPSRVGYEFTGWSMEIPSTMPAEDLTIIATWIAKQFEVTLDANGGMVEVTSFNVTFNNTYGTLPVPSRVGHVFIGWYTSDSFETVVDDQTVVSVAEDHVLYAKWQPVIHTLDFTVDDVSIEGYPIEVAYGTAVELPTSPPTKDQSDIFAYQFSHWEGYVEGMLVNGDLLFEAVFVLVPAQCPEVDDGNMEFEFNDLDEIVMSPTIIDEIKDVLEQDPDIDVDVTFRNGTISFDSESLQSMGGTEIIAIKGADPSELPSEYVTSVGTRPVYEISVGDIHDFGEGTLTIRLDYTLKAGESAENLEIWHFSSGGQLIKESCTYDPVEHCVVFTTDSLSRFAIMHIVPDVDDGGNGDGDDDGGSNMVIFIGAGAAALVLIGIAVFFLLRRKA